MAANPPTAANAVLLDDKSPSARSSAPVADDEKHISTTSSDESSPLPSSHPQPATAGAGGESDEKAHEAGEALKNQPTTTADSVPDQETPENEKRIIADKENGSAGTTEHIVPQEGEDGVKDRGEGGEPAIVYPGGFQLGILTFGLCMATFVVALGRKHFIMSFHHSLWGFFSPATTRPPLISSRFHGYRLRTL